MTECIHLYAQWNLEYLTHALVWCGEACLSNILGALSVSGLIDCGFVWFNNTTCSGKLYRPTGRKLPKAKQLLF